MTAIQLLVNELDSYRKSIFLPENQDFHEKINPGELLEENDIVEGDVFVATDEAEKILGFIWGKTYDRKNHTLGKLGYIEELYVEPRARGQGIAKGLFFELEKAFKALGCDHVTTHTDFENKLSQEFYEQIGMGRVTVEFWKKI